MNNDLMQIQDTIIEYVNVIAQITNVNVEVVSRDYIRIAGTGIFSDEIGKSIEGKAYIYRRVMETAHRHIIQNPTVDDICKLCSFRLQCQEKFEIVTPLFLKNEVIGIIALIAVTEEESQALQDKLDTFLTFIEQMADFISTKAKDYQETKIIKANINTLMEVIDNIAQCVIIYDSKSKISRINSTAKKHLEIKDSCVSQKIIVTPTGDNLNDLSEYKIVIENHKFFIYGNHIIAPLEDNDFYNILIFKEEKQIKYDMYSMTDIIGIDIPSELLGTSPSSEKLKSNIQKIAKSTSTVLVTGESGTGKERVATAIWKASDRCNEIFVPINCAAIPETLLESELFGYVKGAFTGANSNGRMGKFELAHKGVLFLDEIGDLPFYLQAKLLRVLQEKKITRLGSNNLINIDVRIIAATNKDLKESIKEHNFREDLYYRLNVIPLKIDPLRERLEELEEFLFYFISRYSNRLNKYFDHINKDVIDVLKLYHWPGNVRELENTIEYMINMMELDGVLSKETLPCKIIDYLEDMTNDENAHYDESTIIPLQQLEKREILKAIKLYGNNTNGKKLVAKKLGIGIATLYRKLGDLNT